MQHLPSIRSFQTGRRVNSPAPVAMPDEFRLPARQDGTVFFDSPESFKDDARPPHTRHGMVVLRLKQLQAKVGLSRSSIYALGNKAGIHYDPTFPKSFKLSSHAVGWLESDIDTWLESRLDGRKFHGGAQC